MIYTVDKVHGEYQANNCDLRRDRPDKPTIRTRDAEAFRAAIRLLYLADPDVLLSDLDLRTGSA